jgi:predicted nucleic acid-binding protein
LLGQLNIVDDKATVKNALGETPSLARRCFLSAYDAAYLELAMRRGLRLATLNQDLIKAANTAGVLIYSPDQ